MNQLPTRPFSRRSADPKAGIDNEFPESARIGLLHLLHELVAEEFVIGWPAVAQELRRIDRREPGEYDSRNNNDVQAARDDVRMILNEIVWGKAFDFCEFLYSKLAAETRVWREGEDALITDKTLDVVRVEIAKRIQQLFLEENFIYDFVDGEVVRRGSPHTLSRIDRASVALGDARLEEARAHFRKALAFFRDRVDVDYENAVKEAVCAVEAAAKRLFPGARGATLGDVIKKLTGEKQHQIPHALAGVFTSLYAYRNGAAGVSHGASSGGAVSATTADFTIAVAASQIIFLVEMEQAQRAPTPF